MSKFEGLLILGSSDSVESLGSIFFLFELSCEKIKTRLHRLVTVVNSRVCCLEIQTQALLSYRLTEAHNIMAALIGERVGIKKTGTTVNVPNNPTAKLMYYLGCVAHVIQLDNPNLSRLRNYERYYLLSEDEIDALLALVLIFRPDELIGKVFFHSEDFGGSTNEFFELSSVTHMLAVSDNVLIGGERKRVAKIMFFKRCWMEDNFISPLRSFEGRLQRLARGLPGRAPPALRALPPPPPTRPSTTCNVM